MRHRAPAGERRLLLVPPRPLNELVEAEVVASAGDDEDDQGEEEDELVIHDLARMPYGEIDSRQPAYQDEDGRHD